MRDLQKGDFVLRIGFAVLLGLCQLSGSAFAALPAAGAVKASAQAYQVHVLKSYNEVLESNKALEKEIAAFVKQPTEEQLQKTREAWKAARLVYSKTETFRFYGGPIDSAEAGVEPIMNSWPIDESYLDSVKGNENAGLVNDTKNVAKIDEKVLQALNEKGGERNVSTGYHAIEFLLWGQDFSQNGPGERKAEDFGPKAKNGTRRGQALAALAKLLVQNSETLVAAWQPEAPYAKAFVAEKPEEILRRMMVGMTSLLTDEMAGERMTVALEKNDPEHEQDCFSDFSLDDLKANHQGLWSAIENSKLNALMKGASKGEYEKLKKQVTQTTKDLAAIPAPFDRLIQDPKNKDRRKVERAIADLQREARLINVFAKKWGIELNVQAE